MTAVQVVCRIRPMSDREKGYTDDPDFREAFPNPGTIQIWDSAARTTQTFSFDRVFSPESGTQEDVYMACGSSIIRGVFEGYNGCIFAYGQTGSGKTYTMFGKCSEGDDTPELKGVIPRAAQEMFEIVARAKEELNYISITASFLEIYMEQIRDLLDTSIPSSQLQVHESREKGVFVSGLSEHSVGAEGDIMEVIAIGDRNRTFRSTAMNAHSSRSHSVLLVQVTQKFESGETKTGRLNLVDLAGSERLSRTLVSEEGKKEGIAINLSLTTLGSCIHALTQPGKFVPYRDSVLTRLLKESLGGNSKTTLVICGSPHSANAQDTISTLRFGARAKDVKLKVRCNVQRSVAQLEKMVAEVEKEVDKWKGTNARLEKLVEWIKSPQYDPSAPIPPEFLADALPASQGSGTQIEMAGDAVQPSFAGELALAPPVDTSGMSPDQLRKTLGETKERKAGIIKAAQEKAAELSKEEGAAKNETGKAKEQLADVQRQVDALRATAVTRSSTVKSEAKRIETHLAGLSKTLSDLEQQVADASQQNTETETAVQADDQALLGAFADNEQLAAQKSAEEKDVADERARAAELKVLVQKGELKLDSLKAEIAKRQEEYMKLFAEAMQAQGKGGVADPKAAELSSLLRALGYKGEELKSFLAEYESQLGVVKQFLVETRHTRDEAHESLAARSEECRQKAVASLLRTLATAEWLQSQSALPAALEASTKKKALELLAELAPGYDTSNLPPVSPRRRTELLREALKTHSDCVAAGAKLVQSLQEATATQLTRQAQEASALAGRMQMLAGSAVQAKKEVAMRQQSQPSRTPETGSTTAADVQSLFQEAAAAEKACNEVQARRDAAAAKVKESELQATAAANAASALTERCKADEEATKKMVADLAEYEAMLKTLVEAAAVAENSIRKSEHKTKELGEERTRLEASIAEKASRLEFLEKEKAAQLSKAAAEADALRHSQELLAEMHRKRMEQLRGSRRIFKRVQRRGAAGVAPQQTPEGRRDGLQAKVNIAKLPSALRPTNSKILEEAKQEGSRALSKQSRPVTEPTSHKAPS